jgi:excisionase family DNA binding protein
MTAEAPDRPKKRRARKPKLAVVITDSPWLTLVEAAQYAKRSRRVLRAAITDGRLRAAVIGGRKEILTRREWLDAWIEDQAAPVMITARRRA